MLLLGDQHCVAYPLSQDRIRAWWGAAVKRAEATNEQGGNSTKHPMQTFAKNELFITAFQSSLLAYNDGIFISLPCRAYRSYNR
jgi:hypothetical protein